jgi:hypothetical protein
MTTVLAQSSDDKPKRRRWGWDLQVPFWLLMFVMWFGIDTLLLKNIPLLLMVIFVSGTLYLITKGTNRLFDPQPKARTWRAAKLALLQMTMWFTFLFAVLCVMRFCVPPVTISKRTTYLTAPLTADGWEIDLAKAVNERFAPKAKPEDNGFRTVVRLFGPEQVFNIDPDRREEFTLRFLKQLELQPEPPQLKFQDIDAFFEEKLKLKEDVAGAQVKAMCSKPWNTDDFEGSGDWLRENAEALDRFGEAVRMPVYFVPLVLPPNDDILTDRCFENTFHRDIVRVLQCRLMNSLAVEDFEKAIYDTETILRLADRMIGTPVSTQQFLLTRAVQGVGLLSVRRILEFGDISKEQIEQLRKIVQENQAMVDPTDLVFLCRIEGMDILFPVASSRFLGSRAATEFERQWALFLYSGTRFAWNSVFIRFQEGFDRLDTIVALPASYSQCRAIVDWEESRYESAKRSISGSNLPYFVFQKGVYQLVPEVVGVCLFALPVHYIFSGSCYYELVQLRQTEIAVALELFRRDHGEYPPGLDALLGDYLDVLPSDPFTDGEPFHYVRSESDGWSLYSVGPNGIDDDGYNRSERNCNEEPPPNEERKNGDDIRIFIERTPSPRPSP